MAAIENSSKEEAGLLDRSIMLSREFIHRFWNGDTDWCCNVIAEDAIGIPYDGTEPAQGPDGFRIPHEKLAEAGPRVILINETYRATRIGDTAFCVTGTCMAFLGTKKIDMDRLILRTTLIWRRQRGSFLLVQYHFSSTPIVAKEEDASAKSAAEPDVQVQEIIRKTTANDTRNLVLRDDEGTMHFLNSSDIRFLEARGRRTIVHHLTGTVSVSQGIGALAEEVGDSFIPLHRSYLVNAFYIESISYKGCLLDDGTLLPVPSRRLGEIKEAVAKYRRL